MITLSDWQAIPCWSGETVRLSALEEKAYLFAPDLQHDISIGFISKNNHQSLSVCPCLVFFSNTGKVRFFGKDYLLALLKRESAAIGPIKKIEIKASFQSSYSAWYLGYIENFFKDFDFQVFADFSELKNHILGQGELETTGKQCESATNVTFAEFFLKFLILETNDCLPFVKYDHGWQNTHHLPSLFLKNLNLSDLLSPKILDKFLEKYGLQEDRKIISAMIRRNFKIFMHNVHYKLMLPKINVCNSTTQNLI